MAWLLETTATALATWASLFISLIGLRLTFLQAREARKQAEQARIQAESAATAARSAVAQLKGRISLSQVAFAEGQLSTLSPLVQNSEFQTASLVFSTVRRIVIMHASSLEGLGAHNYIKKSIKTIDKQLRLAQRNADDFNADAALEAINALASSLIDFQAKKTDGTEG